MKTFPNTALLFALLAAQSATATTNLFTVSNTFPAGLGSLSNAIAQANQSGVSATNFIQFAIPPLDSNTVHTITLPSTSSGLSPLPPIIRRVVLDGYTQPGASSNASAIGDNAKILIRIDGSAFNGSLFGPLVQLNSGSDGSTVRGLCIIEAAINAPIISISSQSNTISGNFLGVDTDGVTLSGSGYVVEVTTTGLSGNIIGGTSLGARNLMASGAGGFTALIYNRGDKTVVQGNYLGVNAAGTAALGSCPRGIHISAGTGVIVGGTNSDAGNLINASSIGVAVANEDLSIPHNAVVQGNLIGTDATGTTSFRTLTYGISLGTSANTLIGGSTNGAGNVINSAGDGIFVGNSPSGAVIQGNKIGTDITGTLALSNNSCGIEVFGNNTSTTNGTIGGTGSGQGNIIAFSGLNGVSIGSGNTGWSILGNSIHDNGRLGITLAGCGTTTPTTNDSCGTLTNGANHLQMFPVITGITLNGGNVILSGTLNSVPNTLYRLEFFSNPSCDPSGFGQGQVFLGSTNVTTGAGCSASFAVTLPNPGGFANFTATATDPNGNTSEFSACASLTGPCTITCPGNMTITIPDGQSGTTVSYAPTTSGNCGSVTSSPPSGSFFTNGTTPVFCTTTSGSNCSFTITVRTNTPPVAQCHNVTINADANCQAAVPASAVDNGSFDSDGTITNRTLSPPGPYSKGTNQVTLTVVDNLGASNSCNATIVVVDTTPPAVSCPANIVTNAPHGQTGLVVNFPAPVFSDNCTLASTNVSPQSGSVFPLGVTTVLCSATDTSGNSNSCSFTITVNATTTNLTWSGAGANGFWTNAANWVGNIAPANGDALFFPANAARLTNTNTVGGPSNLASITLSGSNYVIISPTVTLAGGLTNSSSSGSNQLEAAVALGADQVWWEPASGVTLTLASNLDLSTFHLTVSGSGKVQASGNITGAPSSQLDLEGGPFKLSGPANDIPNATVGFGILQVDGVLSGGLSISDSGTLQGTGTVPAFTCAGQVLPGGSFNPGPLTVSSGTAVFSSGSTLEIDLFGSTTPGVDYDQIKVSSPPDLSGASLSVTPAYSAQIGETFVIITNTGTAPFTTTFPALPEGSLILNSSPNNVLRLSYVGGDGNDVVLTAVQTNSFEDDTWADGSRTNTPSNPTNSLWFVDRSDPLGLSILSASSGTMTLSNYSQSTVIMNYFTTNATNPVQLAPNQMLTASLKFTPSGVSGTNSILTSLRFGLYDFADGGVRATNDSAYVGDSNGSGTNVLGYMGTFFINTNLPAGNAPCAIWARNKPASSGDLMGTVTVYSALAVAPQLAANTPGYTDGNTYTVSLSVARYPDSNWVFLTMTGPGLNFGITTVDSTGFGPTHFDCVALRCTSAATTANFLNFKEYKVEVTAAPPEPGRISAQLPPLLSIEPVPPNAVRLLWPTNPAGFNLQANTNLSTTNWVAAGPSPSITGTNNVVTNATLPAQQFYRLKN